MSKLTPGVYGAFSTGWSMLRPDQVEAYQNAKTKHFGTMYSMGGCAGPLYGEQNGKNSKGVNYHFYIYLEKDTFYMQFGDKLYHQVIEIMHPPPGIEQKMFQT